MYTLKRKNMEVLAKKSNLIENEALKSAIHTQTGIVGGYSELINYTQIYYQVYYQIGV